MKRKALTRRDTAVLILPVATIISSGAARVDALTAMSRSRRAPRRQSVWLRAVHEMHGEVLMRALLMTVVLVGCSTKALPGGGVAPVVGDPDLGLRGGGGDGGGSDAGGGICIAGQPDGAALHVGDLATAQSLLTGRWRLCSTSSNTIGPWTPASFGGMEFTSDGQFFVLTASLARGDVQGILQYNPLPGPDWEQIALRSRGLGDDYIVSFSDGPRRLRMTGPNSFSASFVLD